MKYFSIYCMYIYNNEGIACAQLASHHLQVYNHLQRNECPNKEQCFKITWTFLQPVSGSASES